jgi:glycine cleavage system H protein
MTVKTDPRCRYTKTHEWVRLEGEEAYAGISDYAQQQLSDIVYVEAPQTGDSFGKGEVFCVVESVKAANDCFMPIGGEILAINDELEDSPELVNKDPYGEGWFVRFLAEDADEARDLMSDVDYLRFVERLQKEKEGGH